MQPKKIIPTSGENIVWIAWLRRTYAKARSIIVMPYERRYVNFRESARTSLILPYDHYVFACYYYLLLDNVSIYLLAICGNGPGKKMI